MPKPYSVPVILVEDSENRKIGSPLGKAKVSTTYTSIKASCPDSCALKESKECYAQLGPTGMHSRRLDAPAEGMDRRDIARAEARAIQGAFGGGPIPQDGRVDLRSIRGGWPFREPPGAS
jgi:hypothetical protein